MTALEVHVDRLTNMYFGKSADAVTELHAIETTYSEEEKSPELRERVEFLKRSEALRGATAYADRAKAAGISVPEEFVRVVAYYAESLKRNECLAKELNRPQRRKKERPLLSVEHRSLLRMLGIVITKPPYNFDFKLPRNKATKKIYDLAVEMEVDLDEDTILKWAREAAKEVAGCREY